MQHDILAGLRSIPYFSFISDECLLSLSSHATVKTFPRHSIILNEGDPAGPLYIILSGKVKAYLSNEEGKEVTLSEQCAGSYFGELSLLDDEPRSASICAQEKTTCGIITKSDFKSWLMQNPDVVSGVIKGLTQRIRHLTDNVRGLALLDVYGRLSKLLRELASELDGKLIIPNRPSQQELACMIGASREMVSKIMKDLTKGDYVKKEGKSLIIKKKLPSSW
jgi:CRP/FNR family cyclic AMP-dependent transcriptional regulator